MRSALSASLPVSRRTRRRRPPIPQKPIRLIVPFPPGAGTDTVARLVAQRLGDAMSVPVIVDNKVGAGGAIGAAEAAKAEPDGYTLLFVAGPFTTVAAASKNPGYDPVKQFVAVAPIAAGPLAFVVNPSRAGEDDEGIPRAREAEAGHAQLRLRRQRQHQSSRAGAADGPHRRTDIVHVPYKGIAPATLDLLSGQIQAITASIPATLPYLAQNKVRVLAVTGTRRARLLPDVPSWEEAGVTNADVVNYWGIVAPAGTPHDVVVRLNWETLRILAQPDVRERLEKEGAELIPGPPEKLAALIEADLKSWKKLIAEANLQLE